MIVAQHPGRRRFDRRLERLTPQADKLVAHAVGHLRLGSCQVPIEQELRLDQECVDIVMRQVIFDVRRHRQPFRQLSPMQRYQEIDRGFVALRDRRRRFAGNDALVAEILHDQNP